MKLKVMCHRSPSSIHVPQTIVGQATFITQRASDGQLGEMEIRMALCPMYERRKCLVLALVAILAFAGCAQRSPFPGGSTSGNRRPSIGYRLIAQAGRA